uniref:Uncharacterized protein n=1 Tax=Glossina pallidipes TaxID=7398 RepID=A0A1A9Z5N8_GLOPL
MIGTSTLSISQRALGWQPDHLEDGISFLWKQISIHGISSVTPAKCIYFMLDHQLTSPGINVNQRRSRSSYSPVLCCPAWITFCLDGSVKFLQPPYNKVEELLRCDDAVEAMCCEGAKFL